MSTLLPLSCPRSACCCLTLGPVPAVIPFILPLEPQGQVCFKLLEKSVGLDLRHTRPQLDHLPTSEGKGEHLAAEAWKCFLSCPERSLRLKEALSHKRWRKMLFSSLGSGGVSPSCILLCKPSLPSLQLTLPGNEGRGGVEGWGEPCQLEKPHGRKVYVDIEYT